MRWHQIITESAQIPNFEQFITPALINELMQTGVWTPHGSDLDQWWEEGALDYWGGEDEGLAGIDFMMAVQQDRDAVARILQRFMMARAGWIHRSFTSGDYGIPPMQPQSPLHRAVCVNDQWIAAISQPRRGPLPLGIFWGLGAVEPWGASHDETKVGQPHVIEITTSVDQVTIDWFETFRSRLDFATGDEEQEIQLAKGSRIGHVTRMIYQASDTRPDLARANTELVIHPSATFIA